MSEYPNYPPPMQPYPAAYAAPYSAIPPPATYQPQYPVAAAVPPPVQQLPLQQPNSTNQALTSAPPPHPPKKNHVPSDQRMKIHTIFMFNLAFNLTHDQLLRFCKQYGDIFQLIFPLVKPGMAFCTYYDLRAAERAVNEMYGQKLNGRPVKTNFAFKPPPHSRRDLKELCSTILVKSSKGKDSVITFEQIKDIMSAFGELRDAEEVFEPSLLKDNDKKSAEPESNSISSGNLPATNQTNDKNNENTNSADTTKAPIKGQWIVKYYDLRDAQKCVETHTVKYLDEELTLDFILDDDQGDESTDPNPPPPPKWMRQQYSHDQRKNEQYDRYDNQPPAAAQPVVAQPPPAQIPYGYPAQPYPYMTYPYSQVPYGYQSQPYQQMAIPQQVVGQAPPPPAPTQISQYSSDQYIQQIQQQQQQQQLTQQQPQLTQQQLQQPIPQASQLLQQPSVPQNAIPPIPPLPPLPPSSQIPQSQVPAVQPPQPNALSSIQPQIPALPHTDPKPPVNQTRSLLSVADFNDDINNQEKKQPEVQNSPAASTDHLSAALSSLMELDSDDTPNDFSNDFDSFDANSNKNKNNNSNNNHQGSLSFLD